MRQRAMLVLALLGALGLLAVALGALANPAQGAFSYLVAFAYWLAIALGALLLVMIHHAAGARWFVLVRRLAELLAAAMPLFVVLFVPIVLSIEQLYLWARPEQVVGHHVFVELEPKRGWLNAGFFVLRAIVYLAVWLVFSELLLRKSLRLQRGTVTGLRALGAAGIPLVGLTLTFAAFDWYMSTEPMWFSTIYGVYYFAAGMSAALALMSILSFALVRQLGVGFPIKADHNHALGRLLFAFVIFWAYMAYSQLVIVWMGDLPEESIWYRVRLQGTWGYVGLVLLFGRFFLPFFALLSWRLKRQSWWLACVGLWVLLMHYIDIYWLLMPVLHPLGLTAHWLDLAAFVGVGGAVGAFVLWRAAGTPVLPQGDPLLALSMDYHSS